MNPLPENNLMEIFENAAGMILNAVGENHSGVKETPKRFAKAMREMLSGYFPCSDLNLNKSFDNVESSSMISMMGIDFHSFCEHHMVPFIGKAYIGYIPSPDCKAVLGASKLIRVLELFAHKFQVQERIGEQVVAWLTYNLHLQNGGGAICVLEAQHMCISSRGVKSTSSRFVTSAVNGIFLTDQAVRAEFMNLVTISKG